MEGSTNVLYMLDLIILIGVCKDPVRTVMYGVLYGTSCTIPPPPPQKVSPIKITKYRLYIIIVLRYAIDAHWFISVLIDCQLVHFVVTLYRLWTNSACICATYRQIGKYLMCINFI